MSKRKLPSPINGLSIVWSRVNQAYFLMWHDQVVRVISDRAEAVQEFERCTRPDALIPVCDLLPDGTRVPLTPYGTPQREATPPGSGGSLVGPFKGGSK